MRHFCLKAPILVNTYLMYLFWSWSSLEFLVGVRQRAVRKRNVHDDKIKFYYFHNMNIFYSANGIASSIPFFSVSNKSLASLSITITSTCRGDINSTACNIYILHQLRTKVFRFVRECQNHCQWPTLEIWIKRSKKVWNVLYDIPVPAKKTVRRKK